MIRALRAMRFVNVPAACVARTLAGALLGAAAALPAAAQLYSWTDAQGVRHYTDTPPPPTAVDVVRMEMRSAPPEAGEELPALKLAREKFPVTLYTTPTCGAGCDEARRYLNERGVPFSEVSVVDQQRFDELLKVSPDAAIPVLRVGETVLRGYQSAAFASALDVAGYPRTGMLPPRAQAAPAAEAAGEGEASGARARGPYAPPEGEYKPPPGPYAVPEGPAKPPAPGPYAPEAERPRAPAR